LLTPGSSLAREAEVAERLAREAGAWLLRELHAARDGSESERGIEEHLERGLRSNFPGDFTPESGRRWRMAAHDGRDAARAGRRGAAVSLALVEDERPLVAVVFAYAAPDDEGDLFCWAEHTGPPRRNGQPLRPAGPVGASCPTLLTPPIEETHTADVTRALHPWRFRAIPSAAYRWALVAAGEADGAVAGDATAADLAAGLALLRAAGCGAWDASGTPLTFHGKASGTWFAGRRPETALCRLPWDRFRAAALGERRPLVRDAGLLRRAQGCWLGQLAGDALGSLVEFQTRESIAARYPGGVRHLEDGGTWDTIAGQPTDDSEMALALARTLAAEGRFDADAVLRAYVAWYESGPFDIGHTTGTALAAARRGRRAALSESQANGSLMRVSPLGIFGAAHDAGDLAEWAHADAALTHPHPVCAGATAVFAATLAYAIGAGCGPGAAYAYAHERAPEWDAPPAVLETLDRARRERPAYLVNSGWVLVAFQNAFYQLLHASSLEEGLVDTVTQGGDTDTNAAIAGALLGAVHGRESIPLSWRDRVLTCRPLAGLEGVRRPRPAAYWPAGALDLAEQLLVPK
jgi:ADP-ribosylglycohydrolase